MSQLKDKVCVVTGGSCGIGKSYCKVFLKYGAKSVVIADINERDGKETVAELSKNYPDATISFKYCDVSKRSNITVLIQDVLKEFKTIDVFAANAGIINHDPMGLENFDEKSFNKIMNINTMHPIWSATELVPLWLKQSDTKTFYFIVTASAAGLLTDAYRVPYTVSKTSAVAFSEFMAINYGKKGIKTLCVCPQAIDTNMARNLKNDQSSSAAGLDGIGNPDDLAEKLVESMQNDNFLVYLNDKVALYMKRKATDHNRWIKGMQRLRARV